MRARLSSCLTDEGATAVSEVPAADGSVAFTLKASRKGDTVTLTGEGDARNWSVCLRNVQKVSGVKGGSYAGSEWGVVVNAEGMRWWFTFNSPHPKGARNGLLPLPFRERAGVVVLTTPPVMVC